MSKHIHSFDKHMVSTCDVSPALGTDKFHGHLAMRNFARMSMIRWWGRNC